MLDELLIVGSPYALGMIENDQEMRVIKLLEDVSGPIDVDVLEKLFEVYGIDYASLPQYLQDRIDEIDVLP